jgi:protein-S-isoprenylcysteine O-methyltransferase Ste14
MSTPDTFVIVFWLVFYAYWAITAAGVKKNVRTTGRSQRIGFRILVVAAIILLPRVGVIRRLLQHYKPAHSSPAIAAGILLCALGLGFAVWARLHLGRNWGQPMTLKEGHELVTTGPYRFVRHPIYAGILLAMLASSIVIPPWFVAFFVVAVYFVYSARTEERIMAQQFPDEYPKYRKRTKALVPLVW